MNISKTGTLHKQLDINCQDATAEIRDESGTILKVVCDGCSEGKNSEVGAKLFCKVLANKYVKFLSRGKSIHYIDTAALIKIVMDELVELIGDKPQDIKDFLSFTILVVERGSYFENETREEQISFNKANGGEYWYTLYYCGDGYVIINKDNKISFKKIDCGDYPKYLAYNYISKDYISQYQNGVRIDSECFDNDCINVGVASDGIRFVADLPDDNPLKKEFSDILLSQKDVKMKLFFNRNANMFQDDFSIVF